jgi:glycosyltransferase involved in cell wall biosynthesis
MKVLHIVWKMNVGGLERAVFQLVRSFKDSQVQADILVANREEGYYTKLAASEGINVFFLDQKSGADFRVFFRFLKIIQNYDAVHFHSVNPILMFASLFYTGKCFFTQRGGEKEYGLKKFFFYKSVSFILRKKYTISGNTNHAAEFAAKLHKLKKPVITTYNGIDFNLLAPEKSKSEVLNEIGLLSKGQLIIGTASKLIAWKRQDLLLSALAIVKNKNFICIIVGDGSERENLQMLVRKLKLEEKVKFIGQKKHVGDYLQIMDIFVLLSDQSESFGNAVLEAMSFGIPPIIMNDSPGLKEHITTDNGFIASNINEVAQFVDKLLLNENLRKTLGSKARQIIEKYTYKKSVESYLNLYGIKEK